MWLNVIKSNFFGPINAIVLRLQIHCRLQFAIAAAHDPELFSLDLEQKCKIYWDVQCKNNLSRMKSNLKESHSQQYLEFFSAWIFTKTHFICIYVWFFTLIPSACRVKPRWAIYCICVCVFVFLYLWFDKSQKSLNYWKNWFHQSVEWGLCERFGRSGNWPFQQFCPRQFFHFIASRGDWRIYYIKIFS